MIYGSQAQSSQRSRGGQARSAGFRRGRKFAAVGVVAALSLPVTWVMGAGVASPGVLASFGYTGAPQTWTVPAGMTSISVIARGAGGGGDTDSTPDPQTGVLPPRGPLSVAGFGALTVADMPVIPGERLTITVGGHGANASDDVGAGAGGGYNGGGLSGGGGAIPAGAGGGATDLRTGGGDISNRVIVAAGGGGAGTNASLGQGQGGSGGGVTATAESGEIGFPHQNGDGAPGGGASQTAGGTGGGALGQGGNGGGGCTVQSGGGGGGGYYGGGGGGGGCYGNSNSGGGGGGSSFIGAQARTVQVVPGYASGEGSLVIATPGTLPAGGAPQPLTAFLYTGGTQTYNVADGVTSLD